MDEEHKNITEILTKSMTLHWNVDFVWGNQWFGFKILISPDKINDFGKECWFGKHSEECAQAIASNGFEA